MYRISSINRPGVYYFRRPIYRRPAPSNRFRFEPPCFFSSSNFSFWAHHSRILLGSTLNCLAAASFEFFSATSTACSLVAVSYDRFRLDMTRTRRGKIFRAYEEAYNGRMVIATWIYTRRLIETRRLFTH